MKVMIWEFSLIYYLIVVCGGVFTDLTGEIKSPNYPLPYHAERECIFLISTPPNTAIRLQFQDFELEHLGSGCYFDFVEVC